MDKERAKRIAFEFVFQHREHFANTKYVRECDFGRFNDVGLAGVVFDDSQIVQMHLTELLTRLSDER